MRVLVTGAAGFIGAALALRLLERGDQVLGFDNVNAYYDVRLKNARLANLTPHKGFEFQHAGIEDRAAVETTFARFRPECVVNMAAQAGVRYSLENPHAYVESNLTGFINVLDACHQQQVGHLVYASSSSVYGANRKLPFAVDDPVDHPVSLYAATKKANELMAHTYSHLYGLPTTGLRFFTVYGPWGRPDMAPIAFARNILRGKPIKVYNHGRHSRDFTYIDDIVEGVVRAMDRPARPNPAFDPLHPLASSSDAPYRVYNIGRGEPVELGRFIELMEQNLGRTATREFLPMQPGDVEDTFADIGALSRDTGYRPVTSIDAGVKRFTAWYLDQYRAGMAW